MNKQCGQKLSSSPLPNTGGGFSVLYPLGIVLVRYGVSVHQYGYIYDHEILISNLTGKFIISQKLLTRGAPSGYSWPSSGHSL